MKKYRKKLARLRERLLASLSDWMSMTYGLKLSSSNPCFIFQSQAETWQAPGPLIRFQLLYIHTVVINLVVPFVILLSHHPDPQDISRASIRTRNPLCKYLLLPGQEFSPV